MKSPIVQNDHRLPPAFQAAGCLARSLMYGVEMLAWNTDKIPPLTADQIGSLYRELVQQNDGDEYRGMRDNCFVMNHEDVMEKTGNMLGFPVTGFYLESESFSDRVRPFRSAHQVRPTYWIVHRILRSGVGHFMSADQRMNTIFDPMFPATYPRDVLSFRSYHITPKEQ